VRAHRNDAPYAQGATPMNQLTIQDPQTRFCVADMKHNGGRWMPSTSEWQFPTATAAANALAVLYRKTRATLPQREALRHMAQHGVAQSAWDMNNADGLSDKWFAGLDVQQASQMIAIGAEAQRVLGHRALTDLPTQIVSDLFDAEAFERGAQARRARLRDAGV